MASPEEDVPRIVPKSLGVASLLMFVGLAGLVFGIFLSVVVTVIAGAFALAGMSVHQAAPRRCGNWGNEIRRHSKQCHLCGACFTFGELSGSMRIVAPAPIIPLTLC